MDNFETGQADDVTMRLNGATGAQETKPKSAGSPGSELSSIATGNLFLSKYQIGERIGSGGMGVVYRCRQIFIGKDLAIKTLNHGSMNDETVQRFQTEAKAAGSLSHPNLVSVHDFGVTDDGTPYMVMDYVPGKTLQDVLTSHGQLPLERVLDIFIECAEGLAHAHEKGVLHRDIKPSNIVLMQEDSIASGSIRILDFGIAKIATNSAHTQELTKTGMVIGSPLYMSPEQSIGKRMDSRTDIYSLGCVLYECLCGTPPFQGDSVIETLMLHQTEKPRSLKEASMGREFPKRLQDLVCSMMEKNFEERTTSMSIVLAELIEIKDQLKNPSKIQKFQKLQDLAKESPEPFLSRQRGVWTSIPVIAAASLIVTGAIASFMWNQLSTQSQPVKQFTLLDGRFATPEQERASYDQRVKRAIGESKSRGFDVVSLSTVEFSPSQFELLSKEKWIRDLSLIDCQRLTGAGLDLVFSSVPIKKLSMYQSELTDDVMAAIARAQTVRDLDISKAKRVTEAGLMKIAGMKNVLRLNMLGIPVSDRALETLIASNHRWFDLDISQNAAVSDNSMRILAKHREDYGLNVSYTSVTDRGVEYIGKNCTYLGLSGNRKITDAALEHVIANCPRIGKLQLAGTSITKAGIIKLAKLKGLYSLDLGSRPGISEAERQPIRDLLTKSGSKKIDLWGF